MASEDLDSRRVRLYVEDEEHKWPDHPSKGEYWLGPSTADPNAQR